MKNILKYGIIINFGALASLCFFAYMFCVSNEVAEKAERMARCYIIPTENNHVDGHVRFYQLNRDSEVKFEIEIFASEISEIVLYSKNEDLQDFKCNNLGEEVYKLQINNNNKPLVSEIEIISGKGNVPELNLFDDSVYNYSCVAKVNSKSNNNETTSNPKLLVNSSNNSKEQFAGCGRLQKYELETSYYFGLTVTLMNLVLGMVYFYKFGI
jgi:hypothetical protein